MVVTDQDQLPVRLFNDIGHGGQLAATDHASLIHHHNRTKGQPPTILALPNQPSQGDRRNPGPVGGRRRFCRPAPHPQPGYPGSGRYRTRTSDLFLVREAL